MTKVLKQGVASSSALANQLNNPKILAFAKAFNFASTGATTTSSQDLVKSVVTAYTETALEADQAQQNPGVQLALYFQQHAPSAKDMYAVLADKSLLKVVQTALDISPLTGAEPIDQQAKLLSAKLKVADFQDPKKLQTFISRFSAMYDAQNAGSTDTAGTSNNAVLIGASGTAGIDMNLIMQFKSPNGLLI